MKSDKITDILKERLDALKYFVSTLFSFNVDLCDDSRLGQQMNQENVFDMITRSRFRRTKLDDNAQVDIRKKINEAIDLGRPIEFSIPFGAYKHWLLDSYPLPDWAEVFNLKYLLTYAYPITRCYPPGVEINFTYISGVMDRVSNLPIESQNLYLASLERLHKYFQQIAPDNLKINLVDIRSFYDQGDLEEELESNIVNNRKNWDTKYSYELREKKIQSARNNLVITGKEDLSNLSEYELEKSYVESAMLCDAVDTLRLRRGFNKYGHNIQLVFVKGPSLSLHIGSCRGSDAHFWVGAGVVDVRDNGMVDTIIPARKLDQLITRGMVKRVDLENSSPIYLTSLQHIYITN